MGDPPCFFCGHLVEAGPDEHLVRLEVTTPDSNGWWVVGTAHRECAEREREAKA